MKVVVRSTILEGVGREDHLHYRLTHKTIPLEYRLHLGEKITRKTVRIFKYQHSNAGTSTCQTNGQFSSVQCTNIQCTDVTIAHATPSPVQGTSFTDYVVTCDEGYHVNGQTDETRTQSARANRRVNSQHCKLALRIRVMVSLMPTRIVILLLEDNR